MPLHQWCTNSIQYTTADLINIHACCIASCMYHAFTLCIMHVCLWDQLLCAVWCCCDHSDELGCFSPGRNTNHSFCFLIFDIHVSTVYIQYVYNIYWMVLVWWSSRLDAFSPGAFHSPHQCWINRVTTQISWLRIISTWNSTKTKNTQIQSTRNKPTMYFRNISSFNASLWHFLRIFPSSEFVTSEISWRWITWRKRGLGLIGAQAPDTEGRYLFYSIERGKGLFWSGKTRRKKLSVVFKLAGWVPAISKVL